MTLFWRSGRGLRVTGKDRVHEFDETIGQWRAIERKQVFRIVLTGRREVVTTGEYRVVDHRDLGVHEVVDARGGGGGGDLGRGRHGGAHRLEGGPLPGRSGADWPRPAPSGPRRPVIPP